jgi:phosphonate ABC transporter permease subunit PhnE
MNKNKKNTPLRSLFVGIGVLAVLLVYAYGFQVTQVRLEQTKSEHRREQLFRILRALARPDLMRYEQEEFEVRAQIMTPCPADGFTTPTVEDTSLPYMVVTPPCNDPRGDITIEGFNFEPVTRGPINFVPFESGVKLPLGSIEVDRDGHFLLTTRLPNRPAEDVHEVVATTRRNIGSPYFTRTAYDTWDKIVETVFLALLATTLGVLFSIPLSFFSARNIMRDISSTLTSAALSILFIPVGIYIGGKAASLISQSTQQLDSNIPIMLGGMIIGSVLVLFAFRWALPTKDISTPPPGLRLARLSVLVLAGVVTVVVLYLLSYFALSIGDTLQPLLGGFGFIGRFIRDLGDILNMAITAISALVVAGIFSSMAGRLGNHLSRNKGVLLQVLHIVLAVAAGIMLFLLIAATINWFYQFSEWMTFYIRMASVGGVLGLALSLFVKPTSPLPTGLVIYYVSRTIFNALRSIEALVMAIVFVVWVGIGPFAGSLALALHTVAALSKLYSEQVESIMAGPIEAVRATGANRLQTIIYAVVPQIIPPYISFTMYRWDINVRMSTIIGFVGGGGIGFLLQQNINLLNYRAASAQMLAIAIVVATMDYFSSVLREKYV